MAQAPTIRVSDYTELVLVPGGAKETETYDIVRSGWPIEETFTLPAGQLPQEVAAAFRKANADA